MLDDLEKKYSIGTIFICVLQFSYSIVDGDSGLFEVKERSARARSTKYGFFEYDLIPGCGSTCLVVVRSEKYLF